MGKAEVIVGGGAVRSGGRGLGRRNGGLLLRVRASYSEKEDGRRRDEVAETRCARRGGDQDCFPSPTEIISRAKYRHKFRRTCGTIGCSGPGTGLTAPIPGDFQSSNYSFAAVRR